jgi:hypothetical protein
VSTNITVRDGVLVFDAVWRAAKVNDAELTAQSLGGSSPGGQPEI